MGLLAESRNKNSKQILWRYFFCNSSTYNDYALVGMKQWNATPVNDAYDRVYATTNRTPETLPSLYPLMRQGFRVPYALVYGDLYYQFLNSPIGMIYEVGDRNILASRYGWNSDAHSDFKDIPFYNIFPWYMKIFTKETRVIER